MAEITKFPVEKVYPEIVGAREIWDQVEPPPEMVWAVCPHVRSRDEDSRLPSLSSMGGRPRLWQDAPWLLRHGGRNMQDRFRDAVASSIISER